MICCVNSVHRACLPSSSTSRFNFVSGDYSGKNAGGVRDRRQNPKPGGYVILCLLRGSQIRSDIGLLRKFSCRVNINRK